MEKSSSQSVAVFSIVQTDDAFKKLLIITIGCALISQFRKGTFTDSNNDRKISERLGRNKDAHGSQSKSFVIVYIQGIV
jgi:hypothetical protein